MWDLSFPTGIEPAPPALKSKVLTPGPLGKPQEGSLEAKPNVKVVGKHRKLALWGSLLKSDL